MNQYYPDDGLDDDNPYLRNFTREEAYEDISRMYLNNNQANENQIVELLNKLLVKYKKYKQIYSKSDKAKSIEFEKDIARYNEIVNKHLPDFVYHYISLHAIANARRALEFKINFEEKIDDLEREYNALPYTNPDGANRLETINVCPGVKTSITYHKYLEIYIQNAPKINFFNREKAKASEEKLNRAERKSSADLEKIRKTIKDSHEYMEHLKAQYELLKQNPNPNEEVILSKANTTLTEIRSSLLNRLTTYFNYAPKSTLKKELISKLNTQGGDIIVNISLEETIKIFEALSNNEIKINSPEQGE